MNPNPAQDWWRTHLRQTHLPWRNHSLALGCGPAPPLHPHARPPTSLAPRGEGKGEGDELRSAGSSVKTLTNPTVISMPFDSLKPFLEDK